MGNFDHHRAWLVHQLEGLRSSFEDPRFSSVRTFGQEILGDGFQQIGGQLGFARASGLGVGGLNK